jgi:ATP-binding cassette, subfamily F, member 3
MVKVDKPERVSERGFCINLSADMASYREALRVKNLVIGYEEPLARVNMVVSRGDKVAIMGENGCGKSTFIRTLMGEVSPVAGKFSFGERVNVGYFSQDLGNLDFGKNIYEEIEGEFTSLSSQEIRGLLGSFGFSGDDVFKRIGDLSGGEKVRVSLCKVFYRRPNVLILDEPTNHLDIVNKENIQRILRGYEGTVIMVSHDRYLIRNVCDRIVVMDGKGEECRIFEGGYDEYLEKREQERDLGSNVNGGKEKKSGKARNSVSGKGKEESAEKRALRLEREIVALEERLDRLNRELLQEDVYMDASRARLVQVEIDLVRGDIERKTTEWDRVVSEM